MGNVRYVLLMLLASQPCQGHGFSGSGLLHPLTGLDHILAMLAMGAWSAQVSGRSLYRVSGCFMGTMLLGDWRASIKAFHTDWIGNLPFRFPLSGWVWLLELTNGLQSLSLPSFSWMLIVLA